MDTERMNDHQQAALWNGDAGRAWVEAQELLDHMFKPIEDMLVQSVSTDTGQRVLDVGCGAGSTSLAASRRLGVSGKSGHCVGIDISAPMIAAARARAAREGLPTRFLCADAQRHVFEPGSVDLIMSRFGVMFFDDFVGAFRNLRHAARNGAELRFVAWRSAEENPFMTTAERAAKALLPDLPVRRPDEPGQFAFASRNRMHRILEASGWTAIDIAPADFMCSFPARELVPYLTRMGPVGRALQDADAQTREKVIEAVRTAFDAYVHGDEVRFVAACWNVSARALPVTAASA